MALSTTTRVLLVEKDRIVRELLEVTLAHTERSVHAVTTVAEAIDAASQGDPIDVALIESSLPDGSGLELGQQLRALDSTTEVLLMSAAPSLEAVLAAVEAGATEYFAKPFEDIHQLTLRIGAAEERARLRRESKWLHNALVESEERYRKLFAATPDALVVFDERTLRIEDANPAALRLYGYSREDLVGCPVSQLRAPEERPVSLGPTLRASDPALAAGIQLRRDERRDGAMIDVELVVGRFQVRGQDKLVEIIRDIGERLREQQTRNELELQLQQSQKLEALGRLAGGVAHDFNNLLAVILNYAQFVADALGQSPANEQNTLLLDDVEQILRAATSATALTRQLLAFSRRELIQTEVVDVNVVVAATERLLRGTLGPKIDFCTKLAPDIAKVRIDRGQLEQVLINLVVNARDAMPCGGRLTIHTRNIIPDASAQHAEAPPSTWVELEISDTGNGIDAAILDKIFDPFFTTKDRDRGTGLGLATVKGIVERAGGCIGVTTQIGVGSCFRIALPMTHDASERRPRSTAPSKQAMNGESILVVDDDVAVRRALCRILKSAGYQVAAADGGGQALAEHERQGGSVDLVITDVLMAGLSGEELVLQLRQKQPAIKVIFATGYATIAVVEGGNASEQRAVLPKPFDQQRLLEVVREVLDDGGNSERERLASKNR